MDAPSQVTIGVRDTRFGALSWGSTDAPLALLVHGYPDTAWTWRHLGPALAAAGWRAVAPFTRGYAPTEVPADGRYRLADLAADVLALHAALDGDERAVLVGHDWGALTTWAVTAVEPGRFARHVALSVPPIGPGLAALRARATLGLALRQLRLSWYVAFNQLPGAERGLDRLIRRQWRDWSPGYAGGEDAARALAALDAPERRSAALGYYRQNLRGSGLRAAMALRPRAPVLYLHGERDRCVQAQAGARCAPSLPEGSRFEVVPGAGHFLQLEDPARVNALILDWVGPAGG